VYLKEGGVALYSPHTTLLSEAGFVADGLRHLVSLELRYGNVVFPRAGNHRALGNVSLQAGDVALVGGPLAGDQDTATSWGGHFKGCLQDMRLDHKYLEMGSGPPSDEVYLIAEEQDVLEGCHSDETCKVNAFIIESFSGSLYPNRLEFSTRFQRNTQWKTRLLSTNVGLVYSIMNPYMVSLFPPSLPLRFSSQERALFERRAV
jgi:hypothetical protein